MVSQESQSRILEDEIMGTENNGGVTREKPSGTLWGGELAVGLKELWVQGPWKGLGELWGRENTTGSLKVKQRLPGH